MKGDSHVKVTQKAFDLLREMFNTPFHPSYFTLYDYKDTVSNMSDLVDSQKDLEFIDVEGGRDNPHKEDEVVIDLGFYEIRVPSLFNDKPHYSYDGRYFTAFNHFIDIKKGAGQFDDFDGYSYEHGSASTQQYQSAANAVPDSDFWTNLFADLSGKKVDEGINWWFNDEYVHAPGRAWYDECSPSVLWYSFYGDKGNYNSAVEEGKKRFPLARSKGTANRGIPYSVFFPVDNMARFWYSQYGPEEPANLGYVMHAIQDASVPHHASGYMGNWHSKYEKDLKNRINHWINDSSFENDVKTLFNQWNQEDSSPPNSLSVNDWNKTPAKNWRIDMLVTWLALNAYHAYDEVYDHYRNGYTYNEPSMKDLTKKATAICMLALYGVGHRELIIARCAPFDTRECEVKKIGRRWLIVERNKGRVIGDFGRREDQARRGLEIIKHYRMNRQHYIGWPKISMTFFTENDKAPTGPFTGERYITFNPARLEVKRIRHFVPNPLPGLFMSIRGKLLKAGAVS